MEKMTIVEIAKNLAERSGLAAKEASQFVTVMFGVIKEALENEQLVKVKGLGTFKIIDVDARESVNVNTGERVVIESHSKITFTPDSAMKEIVNKPFSQFETVVLNDGVVFGDLGDELPVAEEESDVLEDVPEEVSSVIGESIPEIAETVETVEANLLPSDGKLAKDEKLIERVEEESGAPTIVMESQPAFKQEQDEENEDNASVVEKGEARSVAESEEPLPVTEAEDSVSGMVEVQVEEEGPENEGKSSVRSTAVKWTVFSLFSLILVCLAGYGGFYFGYKKGSLDAAYSHQPVVTSKKPEPPVSQSGTQKKTVTATQPVTAGKTVVQAEETKEAPSAKQETAPVNSVQPAAEAEANVDDYSKYSQMDNRVRTGAYRIVGTDHVVTVKAGETLSRITRRTLGEGMSCYIEVYNGLPANAELKEGQKIKIPKLELKKKGKKRSN